MDQPAESPRSAEPAETAPAFEVIHAFPGLCTLVKRSPTLDGQLPLRAAQHCSPVFEGNAAGFQICLTQPMSLRRSRGGVAIDMTAPALGQIRRSVRGAVRRLVSAGLMEQDGFWHRLLAEDAMPSRGHRIFLWSGFLVRPAVGVALRVGEAFNRRSRISVAEHAIADSSGFTPLVLEIDGRALEREPTFIVDEIGCVLPVASDAQLTLSSIRRAPEVVRAFEAFFDGHYFETKKNKPTGTYRRLMRSGDEAVSKTCQAQVYTAGPDVHSLGTLRRFHHPRGISASAPAGISLPTCTVRNLAPLSARWDGQMFTREHKDLTSAVRLLARDWRAAGGDTRSDGFEFLASHFVGPARDEPYWLLQPWVFAVTPAGWSSVVDGCSVGGGDGMRGIIRTDQFHPISMVYRMFTPGPFVVRKGAALLRFFPIPRWLQSASMRLLAPE
jgi:hypothetical protein